MLYNRLRKFLIILILTAITPLLAYEIVNFSALPGTNMIQVRWEVQNGDDISSFFIQRSVDEVNWIDLAEMAYQGEGVAYEYQDFQVSGKAVDEMATTFYYRLKIIKNDGSVEYSEIIAARPRYSGIFRTWGSLKALFR